MSLMLRVYLDLLEQKQNLLSNNVVPLKIHIFTSEKQCKCNDFSQNFCFRLSKLFKTISLPLSTLNTYNSIYFEIGVQNGAIFSYLDSFI